MYMNLVQFYCWKMLLSLIPIQFQSIIILVLSFCDFSLQTTQIYYIYYDSELGNNSFAMRSYDIASCRFSPVSVCSVFTLVTYLLLSWALLQAPLVVTVYYLARLPIMSNPSENTELCNMTIQGIMMLCGLLQGASGITSNLQPQAQSQ